MGIIITLTVFGFVFASFIHGLQNLMEVNAQEELYQEQQQEPFKM